LTLPIQRYAIAPALEGKDVLGCAPTGTGKTLAFLIPILELLLRMKKKGQLERSTSIIQPICLIMAPTRELAIQIDREAKKLIHKTGIKSDYAIGGHDEDRQLNKLSSSRPHILVATPGRLNAFLNKARHGNRINLERIKFIILDEADRMLDMGFKPQIEKMFNVASPALRKQVLMYSATFPEDVKVLAKTYLSNNFAKIIVGPAGAVNKNIYQEIIQVESTRQKFDKVFSMVTDLIEKEKEEGIQPDEQSKILIFTNHIKFAERIADRIFDETDNDIETITSDKIQHDREIAVQDFTQGKFNILVATYLAGRGLDIPRVDYVINFDLPEDEAEYVHRVGRTGRGGRKGSAYSFFSENRNEELGPFLYKTLEQSQQKIPDFLLKYNK